MLLQKNLDYYENVFKTHKRDYIKFMFNINSKKTDQLKILLIHWFQISLEDADTISSWQCTCPRGLFKCHHIAAALLYCNKHVSRTDVTCRWTERQSKGAVEVKTVQELYPQTRTYDSALVEKVTT